VVITGIDPSVMDSAMVSLSWDLPRAVAVRHRIDPHTQVLTRTVSDATGVVEREDIPLEHACVTCAVREDILPTLERLAREGRFETIAACLPVGAEAEHLSAVLTRDPRLARLLRLSSVVAALGGEDLVHDLLGDDLLCERDCHTSADDRRGVGEVGCAQVELADSVVLTGSPSDEATDVARALARPGADIVTGAEQLDGAALASATHDDRAASRWRSPLSIGQLPPLGPSRAWRLDLSAQRAFHPGRLLDQIERLGSGRHRSRGCFWVPTRPHMVAAWAGAGGQLSIGSHSDWGSRTPTTRLIYTGVGVPPADLVSAFEDLLLSPHEAPNSRVTWQVAQDGLEPWLGDIRDVA
jgi:G3E family GTPase